MRLFSALCSPSATTTLAREIGGLPPGMREDTGTIVPARVDRSSSSAISLPPMRFEPSRPIVVLWPARTPRGKTLRIYGIAPATIR